MKKITAILAAGAASFSFFNTSQADLLFSQYAEDGNIKGVEIWNSGLSDITFSVSNVLTIANFNNGSTSATFTFTKDSGSIGAGEVLVFADGSANSIWSDSSISFEEANFSFNGDDALELRLNGDLQDMFGLVGNDPGSSWTGSGVDTRDQNIALIEGITTGNIAGFTNPSTRFETIAEAPLDGSGANLAGFGVAPVPEPSTYATIAGVLFLGLAWMRRRSSK